MSEDHHQHLLENFKAAPYEQKCIKVLLQFSIRTEPTEKRFCHVCHDRLWTKGGGNVTQLFTQLSLLASWSPIILFM